MTLRARIAISPFWFGPSSRRGSSSDDDAHLDAGQRQAHRAGLARPVERQVGAGGRGLGHAPAAAELVAGEALEARPDLDRQRGAARSCRRRSEERSRRLDAGMVRERDPHGRHAREGGRALDLDVAQDRLGVELLAQQDLVAVLDLAQQDRGQRVDVEQRQDAG